MTYNFQDSTFKTAFDHTNEFEKVDLKLPNVVNFVALRETFLSEAPFVNRANRTFWKRWIDSKQYMNVLAASLSYVSECIGDSGSVNVNKLNNIHDNFFMEQMSTNISEMMLLNKTKHSSSHDLLFRKLPELLCYMIVNSLQSCSPRNSRIYNSRGFREILLDWVGELIGGFRMTDCRRNRDWLFVDTNESNIVINAEHMETDTALSSYAGSRRQTPNRTTLRRGGTQNTANLRLNTPSDPLSHTHSMKPKSLPPLSTAVSQFSLEHSPLVNIYLNLGRDTPITCQNSLKASMTHKAVRPLATIRPESMLKEGKYRDTKMPADQLKQSMRESSSNRKHILAELKRSHKSTQDDVRRLRQSFRLQMSMIGSKNITNKQLLAVAALDSAVMGSDMQPSASSPV